MRIKKEKFLPNKKIINKYYDDTKHSRSKVNIENLIRRISGLGLRKFQYILSYEDKKKFDLETFENVARAFNREFKSQKKDIKVKSSDLHEGKTKESSEEIVELLTVNNSNEIISGDYDDTRRKIFSHIEPNITVVENLNIIFKNIKETFAKVEHEKISDDFKKKVDDLRKDAIVNESIILLKRKGVCIHFTYELIPLLSFDREMVSYDDGIDKITAKIKHIGHCIYLISKCSEIDPQIIFKPKFDYYKLKKIIEDNPFTYQDFSKQEIEHIKDIWKYYKEKLNIELPYSIDHLDFEWKKNEDPKYTFENYEEFKKAAKEDYENDLQDAADDLAAEAWNEEFGGKNEDEK